MFEIINTRGKLRVKYGGWPISPKRIKILEALLIEPNLRAYDLAFKILSPQVQDVQGALTFLSHPQGPQLVYTSDYGRWSVIPEKVEEVRSFLIEFRKRRGEFGDK